MCLEWPLSILITYLVDGTLVGGYWVPFGSSFSEAAQQRKATILLWDKTRGKATQTNYMEWVSA